MDGGDRTVVLTVPHAACAQVAHQPGAGAHPCDWRAHAAADCVKASISNHRRAKVFANTDLPRHRCDMNRIRCRNAGWRKKILKYVQDRRVNNVVFVLDVHSFPSDYPTYGRWELVVLDDDGRRRKHYTADFVLSMREKGIKAGWLQGGGNDIHVEMRTVAKVPSFLLEFNEGIGRSRLETVICPAVAEWLSNRP